MLPMALMVMAVVVTLDGVRRPRPLALVLAGLHARSPSVVLRTGTILPVVLAALLVLAARGQLPVAFLDRHRASPASSPRRPEHAFLLAYRSGSSTTGAGSTPSIGDAAVKLGRWFVVDALPSLVGGPGPLAPGNGPYFVRGPARLSWSPRGSCWSRWSRWSRSDGVRHCGALPTVVCATYAFPALALIYQAASRRSPMSPPATTTCGCSLTPSPRSRSPWPQSSRSPGSACPAHRPTDQARDCRGRSGPDCSALRHQVGSGSATSGAEPRSRHTSTNSGPPWVPPPPTGRPRPAQRGPARVGGPKVVDDGPADRLVSPGRPRTSWGATRG